jgi:4-carboxymuconolactone decarboxylase
MTLQQQEAYRVLSKVEGDGKPELPGPLKIWVDNPRLANAVAPLATHFRPPHHSPSQREREITVCVIVGKWHAAVSIDAHSAILIGLGVSPGIADALVCGKPASVEDRREQVICELGPSRSPTRGGSRAPCTTGPSTSSAMTASPTPPS